jgi:hypothetical protein
MLPEVTAGWFGLATFGWMTPLMTLGYSRPLEAPDLYKLPDNRSSAYIADQILASFDARRKKAEEYNSTPGLRRSETRLAGYLVDS